MWQYLFESWVWSIGGLTVGFFLGRTERNMREIKKRMDEMGDDE